MTLLYITYIDFGEMGSGSSVRPQRMAKAFEELGIRVKLVSGLQNRKKERKRTIAQTMEWLKTHKPDACYIEPPSCTIYLKEDYRLIQTVHQMGIPTAVFYRDAHWLYADWWGVKGVKAAVLRHLHRRDLAMLRKNCDMVYFPTQTMVDLFSHIPFRATDLLPPACLTTPAAHTDRFRRMIYVGGVNYAYGTDLLLDAFDLLHQEGFPVELVLCCREKELANLPECSFDKPYLQVIHATGDELTAYYSTCDAGILPLRRERYMDLAIPVKLFEYWGNGLPVIATDCIEVRRMVENYAAGVVCNDTPRALADAIKGFYTTTGAFETLTQNVITAAQENRWVDRAEKVCKDLCPEGGNQ